MQSKSKSQSKLILPYKYGSESAKLLKQTLDIKFVKKYSDKSLKNKTVINWGCKPIPREFRNCNVINNPECIQNASDKLVCFNLLSGKVNIPPYTESRLEALKWLPSQIVCRTLINSSKGRGIVIADKEEVVVDAPLYTKYIKKSRECRVHVFCNKIILVQEKKRNREIENVNWQIRNHDNGFVFTVNNVKPVAPQALREAINAIITLGLDFGAVDIIYNKHEDKWYVLEINTAPGISGTTLDRYVKAIQECL